MGTKLDEACDFGVLSFLIILPHVFLLYILLFTVFILNFIFPYLLALKISAVVGYLVGYSVLFLLFYLMILSIMKVADHFLKRVLINKGEPKASR